jgi:predicted O-methyltransferase YrrM
VLRRRSCAAHGAPAAELARLARRRCIPVPMCPASGALLRFFLANSGLSEI